MCVKTTNSPTLYPSVLPTVGQGETYSRNAIWSGFNCLYRNQSSTFTLEIWNGKV